MNWDLVLAGVLNAGHDIGDMYWLTGAEYRLPLWRIQRGSGVLPVYTRVLSGLVFIDAGNAFAQLRTIDDAVEGTLVGTGVELRLSMAVGSNAAPESPHR